MNGGTFYRNYLENSKNPWNRKLVSNANFYTGSSKAQGNIFKKILTDGNDVIVITRLASIGWLTKNKNLQKLGNVHFARKSLISFDPNAWAVQKNSPWLDALNKHILTLDQAIIRDCLYYVIF